MQMPVEVKVNIYGGTLLCPFLLKSVFNKILFYLFGKKKRKTKNTTKKTNFVYLYAFLEFKSPPEITQRNPIEPVATKIINVIFLHLLVHSPFQYLYMEICQ